MRPVVDTNNPVNFDHPANRGLLDWRMVLPDVWRGSFLPNLVNGRTGDFSANFDPAADWSPSRDPKHFGEIDFLNESIDKRIFLEPGAYYIPSTNTPITFTVEVTPTLFYHTDYGNRIFSIPKPTSGTTYLVSFDRRDADSNPLTASVSLFDGTNRRFIGQGHRDVLNQIGVTYDGSRSYCYINGVYQNVFTHTLGAASTTIPATISLPSAASGWRFMGTFAFLRVHNRFMEQAEMEDQYRLSQEGFPGMLNTLSRVTTFPFGDIFTAAAALTRGGAAFGADATTEPPVFTASADLTRGGAEFDATGTTTGPTFTATADLVSGASEFDASATFVAPVFTASAALERGGAEFDASAVFANAVFSASASLVAGAAEFDASATFVQGPVTATAELTASVGVFDASASFTPDAFEATANLTAPVGKFLALESSFGVTRYLVIGYSATDILAVGQ